MQAKPGVEKCPHCGGINGFFTRVIFDCQRFTSWASGDIDTEGYKIVSETNPRCMDCEKSVRSVMTSNAEGKRPAQGTEAGPV